MSLGELGREGELRPRRKQSSPNLNKAFADLLALITAHCPEFQAFDSRRIVVSISRSKRGGKHGVWAYVTPLRYVGGAEARRGHRRGVSGSFIYESRRIRREHPEALYLMTFLVPRFFELSFEERLETLVHELYHIHPLFRGDLRRFPRPHIHHGPTPAAFRQKVRQLAKDLLLLLPQLESEALLKAPFEAFSAAPCRRFDIPKRVFVRDPNPRETPMGLQQSAPKGRKVDRPMHPRLLDRLLKFLLPVAFLATLPSLGQDFLTDSDLEAKPEVDPRVEVERPEAVEDAVLDSPLKESEVGILPQRFLVKVQGMEEPYLRPAPGEISPELFRVEPDDIFFLADQDPTREWAFLQTRRKSGWVRKRFVKVVRPLPVPGEVEALQALNGKAEEEGAFLQGTLVDGDPALDPNRRFVNRKGELQQVASDHLNGLNPYDTITTLEPGQFYAEPNPLAERYGLIEVGDQVTFLKKDSSGQWARIRLELTGEEGWYPAGWLRVNRLSSFQEVHRIGRLGIDVDLGYGTQGNNFGGAALLSFDTRLTRSSTNRLEAALSVGYWMGESLALEASSFTISYLHLGLMPRYVLFNGVGNLAGVLELGAIYRVPMGSLTGLDADVVEDAGLEQYLRGGFSMGFGAGAYYVFSKTMQFHLGFRGLLSSVAPAYFLLSGLSLRF